MRRFFYVNERVIQVVQYKKKSFWSKKGEYAAE